MEHECPTLLRVKIIQVKEKRKRKKKKEKEKERKKLERESPEYARVSHGT